MSSTRAVHGPSEQSKLQDEQDKLCYNVLRYKHYNVPLPQRQQVCDGAAVQLVQRYTQEEAWGVGDHEGRSEESEGSEGG